MTSLTSKTSPRSWRISSHKTRSEICHLMTGKGWEVKMMSQKSRVKGFFVNSAWNIQMNLFSVLVHHVALQQTLWKKSRRSEAFLPQDHLQVANIWFCLFWSEGKLFCPAHLSSGFWKTERSFWQVFIAVKKKELEESKLTHRSSTSASLTNLPQN